jgi:hypothetical protein
MAIPCGIRVKSTAGRCPKATASREVGITNGRDGCAFVRRTGRMLRGRGRECDSAPRHRRSTQPAQDCHAHHWLSLLEQPSDIADHHVRAGPWLDRGPVKAASPAERGRREAERLDGAEASQKIDNVMVGCDDAISYATMASRVRCVIDRRCAQVRRAASCDDLPPRRRGPMSAGFERVFRSSGIFQVLVDVDGRWTERVHGNTSSERGQALTRGVAGWRVAVPGAR